MASGVRRIEATTGRASLAVMNRNQEMLFQAAAVLKAKPGELREKAEQVMAEMKILNQHAGEIPGPRGRQRGRALPLRRP